MYNTMRDELRSGFDLTTFSCSPTPTHKNRLRLMRTENSLWPSINYCVAIGNAHTMHWNLSLPDESDRLVHRLWATRSVLTSWLYILLIMRRDIIHASLHTHRHVFACTCRSLPLLSDVWHRLSRLTRRSSPSTPDFFPKAAFWEQKKCSFQAQWLAKWPFLHYDEAHDVVFCYTCVKAFKQRKILSSHNAASAFVSYI